MKERCMVMELDRDEVLVATPDFAFHRLPREVLGQVGEVVPGAEVWIDLEVAARQDGELGERFAARRLGGSRGPGLLRMPGWVAVAAVFFLLVIAWPTWGAGQFLAAQRAYLAQGKSIVAMDVNPSLELYVAPGGEVTGGRGLNREGEQVLAGLEWGRPVEEVLPALIDRLGEGGYLTRERPAMMLSVVDETGELLPRIRARVEAELAHRPVDVLLVVEGSGRSDWEAARQQGVSVNRYLLKRAVEGTGALPGEGASLADELEAAGKKGQRVGQKAPLGPDGGGAATPDRPAGPKEGKGGAGKGPGGTPGQGGAGPGQGGAQGSDQGGGPGSGRGKGDGLTPRNGRSGSGETSGSEDEDSDRRAEDEGDRDEDGDREDDREDDKQGPGEAELEEPDLPGDDAGEPEAEQPGQPEVPEDSEVEEQEQREPPEDSEPEEPEQPGESAKERDRDAPRTVESDDDE